MTTILGFDTWDVRFPTSQSLDGSDAMNPAPDYSAAYLVLRTDAADGLAGHAHVFTIGRGNDIALAAVRALEPLLAGRDLDETLADLGGLSQRLVHDSPLRWLGPERGVVHMAIGAVLNACWDLAARRAGKPLWRLLADLSPPRSSAWSTSGTSPTRSPRMRRLRCSSGARPERPNAQRSWNATVTPHTRRHPAGLATPMS